VAIWLVGLAIYLLAVFHRSSLAVAGLAASERFGISAAQLSTFAVLQLLVYTGMQVPVGLILDRFGSRRVMLVGLATLTLAQAGFALAESYPVALVARFFVGVGDAMTFVCVLRLVNTWFVARRIPLVTQLTGVLGQTGAILAAAPMTWSLRELGWTRSYLLAAAVGLVMMVALVVVIHDSPERRSLSGPALSWTTVRASLAAAWEHPGTRLGFWTHFTTQFSATTLGLLWGFPFFVQGEGRSDAAAGVLLTVLVLAVMAAGPVLGWAITHHPWHRSTMVIGIVLSLVAAWSVVLGTHLAPGRARDPGGRRRAGVDDRVRLRPHVQPRAPARHGHRPHQPGRLPRQPDAGARDRRRARLAHARVEHRLLAECVRLGDVVPVRPMGARPRAAGAVPAQGTPPSTPRRPGGLRADVGSGLIRMQ
jgi:MFS family permease